MSLGVFIYLWFLQFFHTFSNILHSLRVERAQNTVFILDSFFQSDANDDYWFNNITLFVYSTIKRSNRFQFSKIIFGCIIHLSIDESSDQHQLGQIQHIFSLLRQSNPLGLQSIPLILFSLQLFLCHWLVLYESVSIYIYAEYWCAKP